MRRFEPLAYVWSTLTIWHLVLPVIVLGLQALSKGRSWREVMQRVTVVLCIFCWLYVLGAIILGQVFGDRFSFAQVWPTSALMGVLASLGIVGWMVDPHPPRMPLGRVTLAFAFYALFLGLAVSLFLYLMPRMVGWFGIVDMPRLSWAVQLP